MKLLLFVALFTSSALAQQHPPAILYISPATLSWTPQGWVVKSSDAVISNLALQDQDLLTRIDGNSAADLGPLSLLNLFDEAIDRSVIAEVHRGIQTVQLKLRGGKGQTRPDNRPEGAVRTRRDEWHAPDFKVKDLNGDPVSLSYYTGRWVLLTFGATWCTPCANEVSSLQRLTAEQSQKLVVIMLAIEDKDQALRAFVATRKIAYHVVNLGDAHSQIPIEYGVSSPLGSVTVPVTVLIRPDLSVAYAQAGGGDPNLIYRTVSDLMGQP